MADVATTSGGSSLVSRIEKMCETVRGADSRLYSLLLQLQSLAETAETTKTDLLDPFSYILSDCLRTSLALTIEDCLRLVNSIFDQIMGLVDSSGFSNVDDPTYTNLELKKRVDLWVKDGTILEAEEDLKTNEHAIESHVRQISLAIGWRTLELLENRFPSGLQEQAPTVSPVDKLLSKLTYLAARLSLMQEGPALVPESPRDLFNHVWNTIIDGIKAEVDAIHPQPEDSNAETQAKEARATLTERRLDMLKETRFIFMAELKRGEAKRSW